jgi:hypothetical protein
MLAHIPIVVARDGKVLHTYSDSIKWMREVGSKITLSETNDQSLGCAVVANGALLDAEHIDFVYDPDEDEAITQKFLEDHQTTPLSEGGASDADDLVCAFSTLICKANSLHLDSSRVPSFTHQTAA